MSTLVDYSIFGKNDIRALVGSQITPPVFEFVGKAYAKYITERLQNAGEKKEQVWISVGMDARLHSPELKESVINGLTSSGINVLDLGLCPTPFGYFSEYVDLNKENISKISGTLIITASHNPPEYNGLKMTFDKNALSESEIAELREIVKKEDYIQSTTKGAIKPYNLVSDYINFMKKSFSKFSKGIKVVVDSGNATGGIIAPELYRELGCEVIDILTEPDGNFPVHHPNPSSEKNLQYLKEKIKEHNADFGIAFDGDSDRIGVVDNTGYIIPGDQLLLIFALDILKNLKVGAEKPTFISEVKCSQVLYDEIGRNNGKAVMWKTGHAFIKAKMKEENSILSGEMSGHIFFKDRFFGFDDAIYAGCRFIEVFAKNRAKNPECKVSDIIDKLPKACTSKEVRLACPHELKTSVIQSLNDELKKNPKLFGDKIEKIITIDGLRIVFDGGFALIRASNTEPTFTLRFEGKTKEKVEKYQDTMVKFINETLKNNGSLCN